MDLTRRSALAASAALAVSPSAAFAGRTAPDPALAAFAKWRHAFIRSAEAFGNSRSATDDEDAAPLHEAANAAFERLVRTRPTTLEGAGALALAALWGLGMWRAAPRSPDDPCAWRPDDFFLEDGTDEAAGFSALFSVVRAGAPVGQGGMARA